MNLEIEYHKLEDLKPYDRNARKHSEKDISAICESIKAFGFNDPICCWGPDLIIVEGHGRLLAAKRLGMEMVPVIRLDHLTDEQRRAYALAHNKTAELSFWDEEILEMQLSEIPEIDMSLFGFMDEESTRTQEFAETGELELDDFGDDAFEVECPECGFRFNPEE